MYAVTAFKIFVTSEEKLEVLSDKCSGIIKSFSRNKCEGSSVTAVFSLFANCLLLPIQL